MLFKLLFAPITGPFEGVTWIARQLQERVDAETNDLENLKKQLLTLQLAFDMGEIPEDEFEAQEEELLLTIQAMEDEAREQARLEAEAD